MAPNTADGSRELVKRAALVAFSTLAGLACLEAYARVFLGPFHGTTEHVWEGFDGQLARERFEPDDELGYLPGPAWRGDDGRYGFQNGAEHPPKRTGDRDWALLGDSLLDQGLLKTALEERLGSQPIRIYNAGIAGYNTLQEAAYLESHITLRPDVLILEYCLNDYLPSMVVVASDRWEKGRFVRSRFEPLASLHPWWAQHSALYRQVALLAVAHRHADLYSAEAVVGHRPLVEAGLDRIRAWSERQDVPLYVLVYPHLNLPERPWQTAAMAQVATALEVRGISYVNLREPLRRHGYERLHIEPDDQVHPNLDGHRIAAEVFLRTFADDLQLDRAGR